MSWGVWVVGVHTRQPGVVGSCVCVCGVGVSGLELRLCGRAPHTDHVCIASIALVAGSHYSLRTRCIRCTRIAFATSVVYTVQLVHSVRTQHTHSTWRVALVGRVVGMQ